MPQTLQLFLACNAVAANCDVPKRSRLPSFQTASDRLHVSLAVATTLQHAYISLSRHC